LFITNNNYERLCVCFREQVIGVYKPPTMCLKFLNTVQRQMCKTAFEHPDLWFALRSRRYDLVITELLASRCDLYLASHLGVPHVAIMSSQMLTWYQDSFDSPSNPSYITTLNSPYPKPVTFVQRVWNVVDYVTIHVYFKYVDSAATAMGRKYFGGRRPDAEALLRNVSMVFLNTHSNFDLHKPLATNFKEIGGIHLKPPKPLPDVSEKYRTRRQLMWPAIVLLLLTLKSSTFILVNDRSVRGHAPISDILHAA